MCYGLFVAHLDLAMPVVELQLTNFSVYGITHVAAEPFHVLTVGVMKGITMWYGLFVAHLDPAMPVLYLLLLAVVCCQSLMFGAKSHGSKCDLILAGCRCLYL